MSTTTATAATSTTFCLPCDQQVQANVDNSGDTTVVWCGRHGGTVSGNLPGTIRCVTPRGATR